MVTPQEESQASHLPDSLYSILEKEGGGETSDVSGQVSLEFHDNRGRNVALCHGNTVAKRNDSYNQAEWITELVKTFRNIRKVGIKLH